MGGANTDTEPVLVVAAPALVERVLHALSPWPFQVQAVDEYEALTRVEAGHAHLVILENTPHVAAQIAKLGKAQAAAIVLAPRPSNASADEEWASKPSELVAAVFRSIGRLRGGQSHVVTLEQVNRFAQSIATQFALPELIGVAVAQTRELCEADGASLLLRDLQTEELYFDAVDGSVSGKLSRVRLPKGRGIAGAVAVERRARLVADVSTCPEFDASMDKRSGFRTGSIVAVPLMLSQEVVGVLMAVRGAQSRPFGPMHLERLSQLAPHVAIAVHNVQITTALRESQSEVLKANSGLEEKVRERTEQISKGKREWERTFDAIDEPIALMDGFTIRRTNSAYARRVGMRVQELPGKTCHKVFAGRDSPCPGCPLVQARVEKPTAEIEIAEMPRPAESGRSLLFRFSAYWISDNASDAAVVVHYQDLTHSRAMAERLRESERLAAVGQLASGAAHEINNPLGFVNSNLRSLRGVLDELRAPLRTVIDAVAALEVGKIDEAVALLKEVDFEDHAIEDGLEMIDESLDGARRVGEIVKGLRELSRLEIGKREPASVNSSVTRAVRAEFGDQAPQVVIELKSQADADIAPLQLDQALGHILRNARQASTAGQQVIVSTSDSEHEVIVRVRDEGAGIAKEHLRRVFEPFFTTRGVGKGIGLGLTAAYGIIKRVGGEIEVNSEGPGKGATFTVRLPRAAPAESKAA